MIGGQTTFFQSRAYVDSIVSVNNVFSDVWRYEAQKRGRYFVIAVYDEENIFLGYL